MKKTELECKWEHGESDFCLKTESSQDSYVVYFSVDYDISIVETNPVVIYIRLDTKTALDEKFYVMQVGGITVRNIAEDAAKDIAKTLNCELTEHCDKCSKEDGLVYDTTGKYEHICFECSNSMSKLRTDK
ncbi:hypothetical protein [Aliivibrio fischeri]|uniref:hypothetical protein n=1 Tax=Aliivibrio fischeri TaxID=668 RepID=UPI0007C59E4D|nr:hypothetical protein [Aliivibrio fischeri]